MVLLDAQVKDDSGRGGLWRFQVRLLELVAVDPGELLADHSAHQVDLLELLVLLQHFLLGQLHLGRRAGNTGLLWVSSGADDQLEIRVLVPGRDAVSEANVESGIHRQLVLPILANVLLLDAWRGRAQLRSRLLAETRRENGRPRPGL